MLPRFAILARRLLTNQRRPVKRISCALCYVFALLTAVSVIPALFFLWVCEFSFSCYFGSIRYAIIAAVNVPGIGTLALAALIGPLIMLVAFLIAFLNCQKTSDTF
jgi:hypothetical protein